MIPVKFNSYCYVATPLTQSSSWSDSEFCDKSLGVLSYTFWAKERNGLSPSRNREYSFTVLASEGKLISYA